MRAAVIVLDSVGIGHAPDADRYGDAGANTLGHILQAFPHLHLPNLKKAGLSAALALAEGNPLPALPDRNSFGVMVEQSAGKDTTTGHWEMAGAPLKEPFAVFEKFPTALVSAIETEAGVEFLGNKAASGTTILDELGPAHLASAQPILYTSADSVLQIAAHEQIFPTEKLYALCKIARKHADAYRIGRVIARPFAGVPGQFHRTSHRHDFSMQPPPTILSALQQAEYPVTAIGKISDIFAGQGITTSYPTTDNADGMARIEDIWKQQSTGLLFANLVDFDMLYGHRRDLPGYARALEAFDHWLGSFTQKIGPRDLLIVTADHGNDPTFRGSDHTREKVPVFAWGPGQSGSLGERFGFADVAATLATWFHLPPWPEGKSWIELCTSPN